MAETRKKQTAKSRAKRPSSARSGAKKSTARKPAAKKSTATRSTAKRASSSASTSHDTVCNVSFCPICQAAKATQGVGPEAFGHLVAAAREFFLAAKVVVEAMPKDPAAWRPGSEGSGNSGNGNGSGSGKLQKISVS